MDMFAKQDQDSVKKARLKRPHVVLTILIATLACTIALAWWVKRNIYASEFQPTRLNEKEQQVLAQKLARLEQSAAGSKSSPERKKKLRYPVPLEPEPYREDDASRVINLSEKELNALVANDPEIARRMAIDLANDLVSVKLLLPIDDGFPILGGKTLRLSLGLTLGYNKGRPVVAVRGVSLGGIPLPGAWWGDIKNKNLVEEFSGEGGFWQLFSRGVEYIKVRQGHLQIRLKE
ncbi:MAG: arginine N-succinyltransferase [Deltaproteobacteria bacterium]|nr:arginine N-succinyltransferase [Deltaproteobacteria bacterium]MBW2070459.1 arginine N-succinyltransferase [Deltaproteobacteria bacterium]